MSSSATNDRAASGQTPAPGWRAESSRPRCKVPRGGEGAVAAGLGLATRTELLARAGTVFARLLLHPPPLGEDAPSSHSPSPPSSATPEGRCTLRTGDSRVGRDAFWVQARLCGSARRDPARRVVPETGP